MNIYTETEKIKGFMKTGNTLIAGNVFYAKSDVPTEKGYLDTLFNWKEADVQDEIRKFDAEFYGILATKGLDVFEAKEDAIHQIKGLLAAKL